VEGTGQRFLEIFVLRPFRRADANTGLEEEIRFRIETAANGHHGRLAKPFDTITASANTFYLSRHDPAML
jgi:hypothetical protein